MLQKLAQLIERPIARWDDSQPISAEIFGPERSKQHARTLAESQTVTDHPRRVHSIINRLNDNAAELLKCFQEITKAISDGKAVTPAAEWLIDNYHLVEDQIRQTRADLPPGYYYQLPKLSTGPLAGHPRIFGLVWAHVAHTDSCFNPDLLSEFVNEYQQVQPLTIGELWAVAISLRLILIENLRRISLRIAAARRNREEADRIADLALDPKADQSNVEQECRRLDDADLSPAFAVQLIHRLRDQDGLATHTLNWLKLRIETKGRTFESVVNDEHHRQSAANVTVRNIITSMRFVSDVNWENWFDGVSLIDRELREKSDFGEMDFPSRTLYRTAVEELARGSNHDELEVARSALNEAANAVGQNNLALRDPGYFLIGPGRADFEAKLKFKPPLLRRVRVFLKSLGLAGYLGAISLVTLAVLWSLFDSVLTPNASGMLIFTLLLAALLPLFEAALAIVNFAVTRLFGASIIPGLALRDGIPLQYRTLVAVPTMLASRDEIAEMVDRLEVHYLSNSAGELYFALVTDWADSASQGMPEDAGLLNEASAGIARLNAHYDTNSFLLLHRQRKWNELENKWMGWERKRGKLHELNRLLKGATDTSFAVIGGEVPEGVKFVLTLDADTKLPRDAARRLVGKLAHPLNRPVFDASSRRVTSGYGVLQPRVTPSLPTGHNGSLFQRIFSTPRGTDPYVFAVSDVYQDLFGEGSFAGKGIYDVEAFDAALSSRIPENTMLSHDLFEGIFARSALVTDIEVVEEYPDRYTVAASRQHRWVRGDWQLLPWLIKQGFGKTKGADERIPALGVWKMADNLRRSVTPIAFVLSFLLGWLFLSAGAAVEWTLAMVLVSAVPVFLPVLFGSVPKRKGVTIKSQVSSSMDDFGHALAYVATSLVFLGHQAWLMADAVFRTIYRLKVSGKNMLEWTTAAQAASSPTPGIGNLSRIMMGSLVMGLAALAIAIARADSGSAAIVPFAMSWILAPFMAHWMSRIPKLADVESVTPQDIKTLRMMARKTWRFFETFVTADDSMLPPDNFQEVPDPRIAHRTSPTNIGLYLLSVASAKEFGWLGRSDAIIRLEQTLATVERMETYRGHLYNWYDTQTLLPLEPKYVSTVDSGNLAGHFIALANYCEHWISQPADAMQTLDGLEDVVNILTDSLASIPDDRRNLRPMRKAIETKLAAFRGSAASARKTPELLPMRLIEFAVQATGIQSSVWELDAALNSPAARQLLSWADTLRETIETHFRDGSASHEELMEQRRRLEKLASDARRFAMQMEFAFLLDPQRLLFSIGFRVPEAMRDESCYDMLASEARLGSFFAIAKGDLRTRHWFRLGRTVTAVKGGAALVSWSGSMFEYLMPSLVMRAPVGSLLDQSTRLIVRRQIDYGNSLSIPWGVSESAFNARDIEFTYQYSNFGIPGLGLKRGLAENLVVAPYSTGLASMVSPRLAAKNYGRLALLGAQGDFGFYEALDFTPSRLRAGETAAVVQAYFAHHQGMTIAAVLNAVKNGQMRDRFHAEPMIRATELLLQERAPRNVPITLARVEHAAGSPAFGTLAPTVRRVTFAELGAPAPHLMSNGTYSVMLNAAGGGYSTWKDIAITRWREESVSDDLGSFFYIREPRNEQKWSAGFMPTGVRPDRYRVSFSEDKAEISRTDGPFTTTLECLVSPEDDAEARRVTITNGALSSRDIELTSYAELVLAPRAADNAHPAFSKMFVETEYVPEIETLIATRRKRTPNEPGIWIAQFLVWQGMKLGELDYETDRSRFIGMGSNRRNPHMFKRGEVLSKTVGAVLDPIFSLRLTLRIPAGRQVRCTLWTVAAASREAVLDLVDRHRQAAAYERAQTMAWTQAQIQLRHLSINHEDAQLFQRLAGHLIHPHPALRPSSKFLQENIGSQSSLWPVGISGDRPILLARIDEIEHIEIIHELLHAFEYWKTKAFAVDLVIINDRMSSYTQDLQNSIEAFVRRSITPKSSNSSIGSGDVFALRADLLPKESLRILPAVARVVLMARRGDLASQLGRLPEAQAPVLLLESAPRRSSRMPATQDLGAGREEFYNGFGGFAEDGREYVIYPGSANPTPAPWVNVIANENFGFQCAADGAGYTWFGNSRENQLTNWSNDPVANPASEAIFVRNDADGTLISPTLKPLNSVDGTHKARHGFGYSIFERQTDELKLELMQTVPRGDSVKISRLKLTNRSASSLQVTVTFYADLVLGAPRAATAPFITSAIDEATGALFVKNPWNIQSNGQVVFADMVGHQTSWTSDRREFLGAFGSLANPKALAPGVVLSNRTGAGFDPCCAIQTSLTLEPGQTKDVVILFGAAANEDAAQALIMRTRQSEPEKALSDVKDDWRGTLGAVQVKTPDRSFDILMNGWLLYQSLACRIWARSGFYQASGAYGFRDQLQDSLSLLFSRPDIARAQILRAAARQFLEGDVQHWWLPESGAGVRTRISDDMVWLSNCVAHYIKFTGDASILDEMASYIEGQNLEAGAHDAFFVPSLSEEAGTLFEHCARGLDRSVASGVHGLPLMGTGDWNDGMNRVGEGGKGESVWLGWFLLATLKAFIPIAQKRKDTLRAAAWKARVDGLSAALEREGWDGAWYRRGFFDDGTPLGSAQSEECRIDAIAQSWSVISGGASNERAVAAMEQSWQQLVRADDGLALLFTPPFDKSAQDPGYVKAYPPGIRENGGQYTHGVIWSIFAHAKLGQADRAMQLFSMLNPINHSSTREEAVRYRVEPYVMAADVYSVAPHVGRGGWTWYTGSAGWMHRAGLEAILGITREGSKLRVKPCIPAHWPGFDVSIQIGLSRYEINVLRSQEMDGSLPAHVVAVGPGEFLISLKDDGKVHTFVLPIAVA
ncbi:MAG: glucoamylase family protein [Rhizobiaceae bacterium]